MKVIDLFSRRLREEMGDIPDTYQYDEIPKELRVQIIHIMEDGLGDENDFYDSYGYGDTRGIYKQIASILRREYGVFHLTEKHRDRDERVEVLNFFLSTNEVAKALDVIQLAFRAIENVTNNWPGKFSDQANDLISELNHRCREKGVGYQYTSGSVIRVDSDYSHNEIVKPALSLLREKALKTVEKEFLEAHAHFRAGEYQDCLTDCGCALESMMKIILSEKGVAGTDSMNAGSLTKTLFSEAIVPNSLQTQFNSLNSLISSGVPTLRNKMGAHGHGATVQAIPEGLAAYCINLTASNLLFLNSLR